MHVARPLQRKPPRGALIDRKHPSAKGLLASLLFNEGGGTTIYTDGAARYSCDYQGTNGGWKIGKHGFYLPFNGTDNQLVVGPNPPLLRPKHITLECIFRSMGDNNFTPLIARTSGSQADYNLSIKAGGSPPSRVLMTVVTPGGNATASPTEDLVASNVWFHAFGTWDGADCKSYLDGRLLATDATKSGDIQYNEFGTPNIVVGGDTDQFNWSHADIALVRIWDRALSAEEIKELTGNPWQLYRSNERARYFSVGAPVIFTETLNLVQNEVWAETDLATLLEALGITQGETWTEADLQNYIESAPIVAQEVWSETNLQNYLESPAWLQQEVWGVSDLQTYVEILSDVIAGLWSLTDAQNYMEALAISQLQLWEVIDALSTTVSEILSMIQGQSWTETELQSYVEAPTLAQLQAWSETDLQNYLETLAEAAVEILSISELQSYIEAPAVIQTQVWAVVDNFISLLPPSAAKSFFAAVKRKFTARI